MQIEYRKIRATAARTGIKLEASVVRASGTPYTVKALATAAYQALKLAINAPVIELGVQAQMIKAVAIVGQFLEFIRAFENLNLSEQVEIRLSRSFNDLTDLADTALITTGKVFNDGFGVTDAQFAQVIKGLTDTVGLVDVQVRDIGKPLADSYVAADSYNPTLIKPKADKIIWREGPGKDLYALDYFAEDYGYDGVPALLVNKGRSNSIGLADGINYIQVGKGIVDELTLAESFTRFMTRSLEDQLFATDDFMGLVNPDDDQVMQLNKGLTETVAIGDTFARVVYFTRSFNDAASLADSTVTVVGKGLQDSASLSESQAVRFGKALTDSASAADSAAKSSAKTFADVASASDAIVLRPNKGISDAGAFTDALVSRVGKGLSDQASIADAPRLSLAKPQSDSGLVGDAAALSVRQAKSDSAAFTDSGSLRMQGYCDFSYFAADYVGVYQTF